MEKFNSRNEIIFITRENQTGLCFQSLFSSIASVKVFYDYSLIAKDKFPKTVNYIPVLDANILEDDSIFYKIVQIKNRTNYTSLPCIFTPTLTTLAKERAEICFSDFLNFPCRPSEFLKFLEKFPVLFEKFNQNQKIEQNSAQNKIGIAQNSQNDSVLGYFRGISKKIEIVRQEIRQAALYDEPVLLLGETGTGKTTAASVIHKLSSRKEKEFQSLNISTVVDTLASSTFFGTESGAYTDAQEQKGIFKIANKGTLLLDEIALATMKVQQILLNVLESGNLKSVGSDKTDKIDVRMIFATNAPIDQMLKEKTFREDLYYRISDHIIKLPNLRDRKEDIRVIVDAYVKSEGKIISEKAIQRLEDYDWPGNIRELKQCLKRSVKKADADEIREDHIDFGLFNF